MAAFAAVNSLQIIIRRILSPHSFSIDPLSKKIIKPVKKKVKALLETLEELDDTRKSNNRKKINELDGRIKEAVYRFEDLLESHVADQILSQLEEHERRLRLRRRRQAPERIPGRWQTRDVMTFSMDLESLQHDADSFVTELESLEEEYISELEKLRPKKAKKEDEDEDDDEEENDDDDEEGEEEGTDCGEAKKLKMVGLSDQLKTVKDFLIVNHCSKHIYGLFGMGGVGKTALAQQLYEDPEIRSHFEHCVWVNVGRKSRTKEYYARAILAQLDPEDGEGDETDTCEYLKGRLEGKKCFIVLDDVWEREEFESLMSCLPDEASGVVQILLTARDRYLFKYDNGSFETCYQVVRFMNEGESMKLLCEKVFGEEGILPSRLKKAAEKIARKCEGLPLLIIAVAGRLSEGDMTEEYWNEVVEERNSVFKDALDEVSKVLFPSYEYLTQNLKMFFLYLGVFPPDREISPSNLMNQLRSEGWFQLVNDWQFSESDVLAYLNKLCLLYYLVLFNQKSMYWYEIDGYDMIKTCRLHCSWRYLCQVEARKIKFYHVLNRLDDCSEEVVEGQRCLCLHNNILLSIEDLHDSVQHNCASSTRSLLCFGPYHQYPVPIFTGLRLLGKLDALNLRFYTFPTEILELVQLRYLALTCNGELPPTISKLFILRVLIVHPHTNVKIRGAPSYIPVQIWDMQELEHIEILGRSLQAPHHIVSLDNLTTVLGVNTSISVLLKHAEKFVRIEKLGFQIELTPYEDDTDLLNCFRFISRLELDTLKCSIVNPEINYQFRAPPTPNSLKFSDQLEKLHLSGTGFPWEYMDVIGSLPYLEVLKLRCYAFRGPKWDVKTKSFPSLKFLLIEDSDLEQWLPGPESFPELTYLCFKHCYKLQEFRWPSASSSEKIKIELVDSNPVAVTCAKQLLVPKECVLNLSITSSYGKLARQGI